MTLKYPRIPKELWKSVKITPLAHDEMNRLREQGWTIPELSEKYGVCYYTIQYHTKPEFKDRMYQKNKKYWQDRFANEPKTRQWYCQLNQKARDVRKKEFPEFYKWMKASARQNYFKNWARRQETKKQWEKNNPENKKLYNRITYQRRKNRQ